jgi:hypothetical protein
MALAVLTNTHKNSFEESCPTWSPTALVVDGVGTSLVASGVFGLVVGVVLGAAVMIVWASGSGAAFGLGMSIL